MKVIGNRLLVSFVEKEEQKEDAILVANKKEELSDRAEVVAVGDGVDAKHGVKEGDLVLVTHCYGNPIEVDGKTCNIAEFDQVLMILNKESK